MLRYVLKDPMPASKAQLEGIRDLFVVSGSNSKGNYRRAQNAEVSQFGCGVKKFLFFRRKFLSPVVGDADGDGTKTEQLGLALVSRERGLACLLLTLN